MLEFAFCLNFLNSMIMLDGLHSVAECFTEANVYCYNAFVFISDSSVP